MRETGVMPLSDMESMEEQKQWHSSFYNAIFLRYFRFGDKIEIIRDHSLTHKPLQIDVIVIRNDKRLVLNDPIGSGFKVYNILEYKSPGDGFSVDDFYKLITYGMLYKIDASHADEIHVDDISLTIVREERSNALMKYLREKFEAEITRTSPGVYRVEGAPCPFAVQIVAYREMDEESECWLRALTRNLSGETISGIASSARELTIMYPENQRLRDAIESVADIAYRANPEMFAKGEKDMMRIYTDYIEPAMKSAEARGISIGEARGISIGEAKGIISMGRKFNIADSDILAQLVDSIKCSMPEARKMLADFA